MSATERAAQQRRTHVSNSRPPIGESPGSGSGSSVPQKRSRGGTSGWQKIKVTRACDICKAKKSKCSGEQPCESCNRRGLNCQYEAVYLRGRAPTPRRTEPADHSLLDRQSIGTHQNAVPVPSTHLDPGLSGVFSISGSTATSMPTLASTSLRPRENEATQDAPSRGSPELEVAGQYSDPTSGLSFLHRAWRRISNNENSQVMSGHMGSMEDSQLLTRAGDKPFLDTRQLQLPSLSRGHEFLALYFDVCIATYRILHRPSVESWFTTVSQNAQCGRPLFFGIGRARAATVLSVLAIASFHEDKAKGNTSFSPADGGTIQSQSDELFCEASRFSDEETGIPRLESAQSRIVQVLYLLMSCRFNQAWYTFGHSLQIISTLGLHRRDDHKRTPTACKRDYIEAQCRKRTFWVAYTLDKYLGVIFGRPRHYHDDDIDQGFPDSVNDEDMTNTGPHVNVTDDCHIDSLINHAKLAQIAERISREVYSIKPVPDHVRLASSHRLGAELRQWRASLPPFLGAINPSSLIPSFRRQAVALKLSYCHAVMLAHRPFLLKNTTRNSEEMKSLAKEGLAECISAAQSVLELVDRMAREGPLFHAFWWTHYVCFCALVVVYVWAIQESSDRTSLHERRTILDQAERCLQHLAQATATNSPSRKYSIILQELRAEAKRKTVRPVQEQAHVATVPSISTAVSNNDRPEALHENLQNLTSHEPDAAMQMWQPLFGSPIDTATPGLQNFMDDWQTTDWLHLDSSAFATIPEFNDASMTWMNSVS